ncbi:bifunctional ADP-dependent NAD(P)H-hydrate dehydratase/NAD(P)H-hydrate epimerase [Parasphingorhabdus litoris]|uniref:Bifunctional NAD(P)H-hydrate repair enzyme n=1 Tax=Parasphingorhabdus litoris TaxID=394733 RepID=A0ABN1AS36_9SPHN|nr:NAD(P)H-hydrate dehydratase [Parasphingorhabdus litoris]
MLNNGHILTAAEMQEAEQHLIANGSSVIALMDRAGSGAADYIWRTAPHIPTLVICGPGNNGGDGYVIAQALLEKGAIVKIVASAEPSTDAAKTAKSLWQGVMLSLEEAEPEMQFVDCLFGTGLTRPVSGNLLKHYHRLSNGAQRRVAIDLPSGIETDTGSRLNEVSNYDLTIALGAYKPAHYLNPAAALMGDRVGVDIGVRSVSQTKLLARRTIAEPGKTDHKYSRGLVAIVAGPMKGAAKLSALAAQRSGAGYVKIFAGSDFESPNHSIVTVPCDDVKQLRAKLADERIGVIVIGPGLGRDSNAKQLLDAVLEIEKPVVLDADALMLLGDEVHRLQGRSSPVAMTPHSGEFAALSGGGESSKIYASVKLAAQSGAVVVHKGSDTVIANPMGDAVVAQQTSNWLSTAGTGDILAGMIAARFTNEKDMFLAAQQGQWLHSRAASLAGPSFSPEILIDHIAKAIQECL